MRPCLGSAQDCLCSLCAGVIQETRTLLPLPRYVLLAERLGYVVNVVEPWEICAKWHVCKIGRNDYFVIGFWKETHIDNESGLR